MMAEERNQPGTFRTQPDGSIRHDYPDMTSSSCHSGWVGWFGWVAVSPFGPLLCISLVYRNGTCRPYLKQFKDPRHSRHKRNPFGTNQMSAFYVPL